VFIIIAFSVHHFIAEGQFSSIVTMSSLVQCLGIVFLCIQVLSSKVATGISAGALMLDAFSIAFRLSSTSWLNGYVPVDPTGDLLYQSMDTLSLVLIMCLLYKVMVIHRDTYQVGDDSLSVTPLVIGCLVLAAILHSNKNNRPLFDTLWMAGVFAGVVAVLPQLWLITRSGGRVQALTSHYIAALALSRTLSGVIMWYAASELTCNYWIEGFEHASWAVLAAHAIQLLLIVDFAYHYAKSVATRGLREPLELPTAWIGGCDSGSGARWV
jgi:hypothetical protein